MLIKIILSTAFLAVEAFNINAVMKKMIKGHPQLIKCLPSTKMIDASGKIPSGITDGNYVDLGNFDLCLYHKNTSEVEGKYCIVKIIMPILTQSKNLVNEYTMQKIKTAIQERSVLQELNPTDPGLILGMCIPKTCPVDEFTTVLSKFLQMLAPTFNTIVKPILDGMCQTKDDLVNKYDTNKILLITFLSITLLLMIISTVYDVYLQHYHKKPVHIILLAFSVKTNGQKLLSISNNPDQLQCLNGIRFMTMVWVIYGHSFSTSLSFAIINLSYMESCLKSLTNMNLSNAALSVDTFLVLSGLLVAYGFLAKDKEVNFNILMFYIHRYLRLTPVLAVVIWIHVCLLDLFGSGPIYPLMVSLLSKTCQNYWWSSLVYIQNYYNSNELCIEQTWYLSVDMHLFILSPILLIPLCKWPKRIMYVSAFLVLVSMAIPFALTYMEDLEAFALLGLTKEKYLEKYYNVTHVRFGPWIIGFMLGYYLYKLKKNSYKIDLHPVEVTFGWIIGIGLLLSTLYGGHDLSLNPEKLSNSFFNGLHRHGWSLGVCWVIFACTQGYGGPVNSFLCWSVFQVLAKFTYTAYLTHGIVINLVAGISRTNIYYYAFDNMYVFWGHFMVSFAVSICLTLAYESPMLTIEKVLFKTGRKSKKSDLPLHHLTSSRINNEFSKDEIL